MKLNKDFPVLNFNVTPLCNGDYRIAFPTDDLGFEILVTIKQVQQITAQGYDVLNYVLDVKQDLLQDLIVYRVTDDQDQYWFLNQQNAIKQYNKCNDNKKFFSIPLYGDTHEGI